MLKLITPHIPLDSSLDSALGILESLGCDIVEYNENELSYRVDTDFFSVAIYPFENGIKAVWYDDPIGREF